MSDHKNETPAAPHETEASVKAIHQGLFGELNPPMVEQSKVNVRLTGFYPVRRGLVGAIELFGGVKDGILHPKFISMPIEREMHIIKVMGSGDMRKYKGREKDLPVSEWPENATIMRVCYQLLTPEEMEKRGTDLALAVSYFERKFERASSSSLTASFGRWDQQPKPITPYAVASFGNGSDGHIQVMQKLQHAGVLWVDHIAAGHGNSVEEREAYAKQIIHAGSGGGYWTRHSEEHKEMCRETVEAMRAAANSRRHAQANRPG
jgi:hypothetical protein